jgi:hypothetical protein
MSGEPWSPINEEGQRNLVARIKRERATDETRRAMTDRIPPTEAELKRGCDGCVALGKLLDNANEEIRRLRAMCRAAIPFIERHPTGLPGEYRAGQMIDELDKASKGEA